MVGAQGPDAILTEPTDYMEKLRVGGEIIEVVVTGFRDQYPLCTGPETIELNSSYSPTVDQSPCKQTKPKVSVPPPPVPLDRVRQQHIFATKGKPVCIHYSSGKCKYGYKCNYRHPESTAPRGWTYRELDPNGDVRGTPTTGRMMCQHHRDGHCRHGDSCRHAHYAHAWSCEESNPRMPESSASLPQPSNQPSFRAESTTAGQAVSSQVTTPTPPSNNTQEAPKSEQQASQV